MPIATSRISVIACSGLRLALRPTRLAAMTLTIDTVTIGTWVRFWKNGRLELGVVQYPPHQDTLGHWLIDTDKGRTSFEDVVEVRL